MDILHTTADLRAALGGAGRCAFVPTMGNLHEGHLALVRQAAAHRLPLVTSIFVNRLQFAPHEDYERYPRTLARDVELLRSTPCDLVFAPSEREMYPDLQAFTVQPDPAIADILEGHFRPGFFTGVCTVVMKFFGAVQPKVAVFGKKDYQQLLLVERMVRQFSLDISIEGVETLRAADGLALSSRNGYLSDAERTRAAELPKALASLAMAFTSSMARSASTAAPSQRPSVASLEALATDGLRAKGWEVDYLSVRRRDNLAAPVELDGGHGRWVALGAARIGTTRLIDNLEFGA
jgi:pantoate--beta-alanine ligase